MLDKFLPHLKYPYATAIVAIIWLGVALFLVVDPQMPIAMMIAGTMVVTVIVSAHALRLS